MITKFDVYHPATNADRIAIIRYFLDAYSRLPGFRAHVLLPHTNALLARYGGEPL